LISTGSISPRFTFAAIARTASTISAAPPVAERQHEREPVVSRQRGPRLLELLLHGFRQTPDLANGFEPDVVAVELANLALEEADEVLHQGVHLVLGAVPVLRGKGVKRQVLQPSSPDARTTARTDSTPFRCPSTRGRWRCFANAHCHP
jgi:hypothetical protein